jgi:hypothetical protein
MIFDLQFLIYDGPRTGRVTDACPSVVCDVRATFSHLQNRKP